MVCSCHCWSAFFFFFSWILNWISKFNRNTMNRWKPPILLLILWMSQLTNYEHLKKRINRNDIGNEFPTFLFDHSQFSTWFSLLSHLLIFGYFVFGCFFFNRREKRVRKQQQVQWACLSLSIAVSFGWQTEREFISAGFSVMSIDFLLCFGSLWVFFVFACILSCTYESSSYLVLVYYLVCCLFIIPFCKFSLFQMFCAVWTVEMCCIWKLCSEYFFNNNTK